MIQYNVPFEVSEAQFVLIRKKCQGIVTFRQSEGKYYIKVFFMKHVDVVQQLITV